MEDLFSACERGRWLQRQMERRAAKQQHEPRSVPTLLLRSLQSHQSSKIIIKYFITLADARKIASNITMKLTSPNHPPSVTGFVVNKRVYKYSQPTHHWPWSSSPSRRQLMRWLSPHIEDFVFLINFGINSFRENQRSKRSKFMERMSRSVFATTSTHIFKLLIR